MRVAQICLLFLLMAIFCQCASKATPPGGPKDETPPRIVLDKSTPNEQLRFDQRSFTITLDEWVALEDAQTQVLISPPLEKRPEIKIKGKSVVFRFHEDEVLKENATYSINFGDAIQDITERNPLSNFIFVFSTGDVIDSLFLTGKVLDSYLGEPVEGATIMVYSSSDDSVSIKEKPFYATRSDKAGDFTIRNMKEGSYQVVAIIDDNLNYLYDAGVEQMAFLDSVIKVGTENDPIQLNLSTPEPPLYLDKRDTSGWNEALYTFSRKPHNLEVSYENAMDSSLRFDLQEDKLHFWYFSDVRREWEVYVKGEQLDVDTMILKFDNLNAKAKKMAKQARLKNSAHPADPVSICFDRPIVEIDTSQIIWVEGVAKTRVQPTPTILDSLTMCLLFEYPWKPDSTYELLMLPGALTDLFEMQNDSIAEKYSFGNAERFGNVIMTIDGLSANQAYLVELGIKDKAEHTFFIEGDTTYHRTVDKLKPGTYGIRVIEDRNRNGRWDSGNLLEGFQPEKTHWQEIEQLRANWDVDVNIKWN